MGQEQFDSRSIAGGVDLRIIMIMSNIMMTTITKIMIMMTIIVRMMMMITMVTICSQAGRLVGSSVTQELVFWSHDNSPSFDPRTNDEKNEDQRSWLTWRWSGPWCGILSPEADTLPSQREPWWLLSSDLTTITMMIILIYHHYYHFNKEEKIMITRIIIIVGHLKDILQQLAVVGQLPGTHQRWFKVFAFLPLHWSKKNEFEIREKCQYSVGFL